MKFSIIICAKNEERNIAEMLDSIRSLKTSARDYEVIVVNDHSNDKTVKIAKNSGIKKLKILKTAGHGVAATRNTGILAAEGKIIVFADCDGVLEDKCLAELSKVFDKFGADFVQGNIWEQYYTTKANRWLSLWRKTAFLEKVMNDDGTLNSFNGRFLAVKVSCLEKVNGSKTIFDSSLGGAGGEDKECGERMYRQGAIIKLADKAIIKHKDPVNLSKLIKKRFKNGIADSKAGVGEKFFDIQNFRRAVICPWKRGVPLWLCFSFWFMYIAGNLYYHTDQKLRWKE